MDVTKRNHYNPCFWTALWNVGYYEGMVGGNGSDRVAREQTVHVLNARSQSIYKSTVERVHFDKHLGLAEITRSAAEEFVSRYHPEQYERFVTESRATVYPIYLDFENILSGIEATDAYKTLLKVATSQTVVNLIEKSFLASFVVFHSLRSHSIMNAMIDWHEEIGQHKFEHLVTLKWMLSDPVFLFRLVYPLVCSRWSLFTTTEHVLPLCDSPILIQPDSIMVALTPRLLLEISTQVHVAEDSMPTSERLKPDKLDEYRRRTIGNTFREIIGEEDRLQDWMGTSEFRERIELLKDVKRYNTLVRVAGEQELWHLNSYGNRS